MAVINVRRQSGYYVPTLVETPEYIFIDGTCHDKSTLNPQFMKDFEFNNTNNALAITMNRFWIKHGSGDQYNRPDVDPCSARNDGGSRLSKVVWDSVYDASESYLTGYLTNMRTTHLDRKENRIIRERVGDSTATMNDMFYVDEDADYIYCFYKQMDQNYTSGVYGNWWGFGKINKKTWAWTAGTYCTYHVHPTIVLKTATHIFYTFSGGARWNTGRSLLYSWNRSTGVITSLADHNGDRQCAPHTSFARNFISATPTIYSYFSAKSAMPNWAICRVDFNTSNPTGAATVTALTKAYDPQFNSTDIIGLTASDSNAINPMCFVIKDNVNSNNDYLGFAVYERSCGSSEPQTIFNLYVWKMDQSNWNTITLKQKIVCDTRLRMVMPIDQDFNEIILIYENYIQFMHFNFGTGKYEENYRFAVNLYSLGIDELDRIWAFDNQSRVFLMSNYIPGSMSLQWEKKSYEWGGVDVVTWVEVDAWNRSGQRLAMSCNLEIQTGNAVFSNGGTNITVTLSATQTTRVPVTIKDAGYVKIITNAKV